MKKDEHDAEVLAGPSCFIPTISALAMQELWPYNEKALYQDVSQYFDVPGGGGTWLDKYTYSFFGNLQHIVESDRNQAGWLYANLLDQTVFGLDDEGQVWSLPHRECFPVEGGARDVGVSPDGTVWIVTNEQRAGGYVTCWLDRAGKMWKKLPDPIATTAVCGWVNPGAAMAMAVTGDGNVEVLRGDGWRANVDCPDKARDIGANTKRTVWILTKEERYGGYAPSWSSRTVAEPVWNKLPTPAAATRVAVLPNSSAMTVNANGDVWRLNQDGTGEHFQGVVARDIGVGSDGTVWVVSNKARRGGFAPCWLEWGSKTWHELPEPAAVTKIAVL